METVTVNNGPGRCRAAALLRERHGTVARSACHPHGRPPAALLCWADGLPPLLQALAAAATGPRRPAAAGRGLDVDGECGPPVGYEAPLLGYGSPSIGEGAGVAGGPTHPAQPEPDRIQLGNFL